jgi:hypothetical protein
MTDILQIDAEIKRSFAKQKKLLPEYRSNLVALKRCLESDTVSYKLRTDSITRIAELEELIADTESDKSRHFYLSDTLKYIVAYKKILTIPIIVDFMDNRRKKNPEKIKIVEAYMCVAAKYIAPPVLDSKGKCGEKKEKKRKKHKRIVCKSCNNKNNFEVVDEYIHICLDCGRTEETYINVTSFKDINRVNISKKYEYERRIHFSDTIKQYQGKQNSTIDQKVYDELEDQFDRHHLLVGDASTPRKIRFGRILKMHVQMFLKELGYCKHYENFVLIHYDITEQKPDDISHLEAKLLSDFDKLAEMYDKLYSDLDRISFLNSHYTLNQLLRKHKHKVDTSNLNELKTIDRLDFHNEVTENIFRQYGWNFSSF